MVLKFPPKFEPLIKQKARYKIPHGGRGKGTTWNIARAYLIFALEKKRRFLCTREFQNSIADSVHKVLVDQILLNGWSNLFNITKDSITAVNGSNFIFKGLHANAESIKSIEGVDYCWIAEAEKVSQESMDFLFPTIRKEESEIWIDFNPYKESDPIMQFIKKNPPDSIIVHMTYEDNPWFPEVLRREMEWCKETDIDKYNWIWLGQPLGISDALVFKDKFIQQDFETPEDAVFYCGLDFGFSQDPTAANRCFVKDQCLYIDREAGGQGIEIDHIGTEVLDKILPSKQWPCVADSARPETISFLNRQGYNIKPSKKGAGSVEDGIQFIRSFKKVIIHTRCPKTFEEFNLYSYKKDKLTGQILPIPIDANNHHIDDIRYATEQLQKPQVVFLI